MDKKHPDGTYKHWEQDASNSQKWIVRTKPDTDPNFRCGCGSETFRVCWWDYPYTGGYLRLVCSECGEAVEVMDDYS